MAKRKSKAVSSGYPMFISPALDKFQVCCEVGCERDAAAEFQVVLPNTSKIFLAACPLHHTAMADAAERLERGESFEALAKSNTVDRDEVFIAPPTYSTKCRLTAWEAYSHANDTNGVIDIPASDAARTVKAVSGWAWTLNVDRWRNVDGKVLPLRRLRLAELLSAVLQIVSVNYEGVSKLPRKLAWVKRITPPEIRYEYPEDEITVGEDVAQSKLDDMKSELRERQVLK